MAHERIVSRRSARTVSILIFVSMFATGLLTVGSPVSEDVAASITGDAYSGSGDWVISNPTVYIGETFTVYGNITIGASLTLQNTALTLDQPAALARKISNTASAPFVVNSASWVGTTNQTDGKYNAELKISGGYIWADDCTFDGFNIWIGSAISYFNHAIFYGCAIWNNYGLGWETGEPVSAGPLMIHGCQFLNTNTTSQPYPNLITAGNNLTVEECTFTNITLHSGLPNVATMIRVNVQNGVRILHNTFASSRFSAAYFHSYAPYVMTDNDFHGNHFLGVGGTVALIGYAVMADAGTGTVSNCRIDGNTFDIIRNGSKGIYVAENTWTITNNVFGLIDSSGLTSTGQTIGIFIGPPGHITVSGNLFNRLVGPGQDTGAACLGINSQSAGGYTVSHNTLRNLSYLSCAISIVDPIPFATLTGISIHANTISNLRNASGGVAIFGGNGAVVSWNNISIVDGPSVGVMVDGNGKNATIHDNSVTGMFDTPNVWSWPDGWQIVVGAYCYYASGNIYDPEWIDNHASGGTMAHPDYNITGEKLGGGWWPNARMLVDTSDHAIIHYQNANVTLRHDGQALLVLKDGVNTAMTHYPNGTSLAWFNKTDLNHHFVNVTPTDLHIATDYPASVMVAAISAPYLVQWNVNATTGTTVSFTLSGLHNGMRFGLYVDGVHTQAAMSGSAGTVTFTYSGAWSDHDFAIREDTTATMAGPFAVIGFMIIVVIAVAGSVGVAVFAMNMLRER